MNRFPTLPTTRGGGYAASMATDAGSAVPSTCEPLYLGRDARQCQWVMRGPRIGSAVAIAACAGMAGDR
jgi:hypothetical protein